MSKEAQLADGTILEFPDNTPDDVIDRAVRQHLGAQPAPSGASEPDKAAPTSPAGASQFFPGGGAPFAARGALGIVENALSMIGGAGGVIIGGAAAAPVAVERGMDEGENVLERVSGSISKPFQPRTPAGKLIQEKLGSALDVADTTFKDVMQLPPPFGFGLKNPTAATVAETAIKGVPSLFGLKRGNITLNNKQQIVKAAQEAGYKLPPGNTNPNMGLQIAEGISGRPAIRQRAAELNLPVHNRLANRALGLPEDLPITREGLEAFRANQGQAYAVIDSMGQIFADTSYRRGVSQAVSSIKKASGDFPSLAKKEGRIDRLLEIANDMQSRVIFDTSSARGLVDVLRGEADDAFRNGHKGVGRAYRDLSKVMEDNIERRLSAFGNPGVVQAFKDARQKIAQSYSVQEALVGDGIINPANLRAQLKRGVPLTDELKLIAKVNEQFPQSTIVSPVIKEGVKPFSVVDAIVASGAGAASFTNPALGLPALAVASRPFVRAGLLSNAGQKLAFPGAPHPFLFPALAGPATLATSPEKK